MTPPTTNEPQTEAGRAAQHMVPHFDHCAGLRGPNPCDCGVVEHILAVEAEAARTGGYDEYKEATDAAMNYGQGYEAGRAEATRTALEGVAERVRVAPLDSEVRRWLLALLTPAKEDGS